MALALALGCTGCALLGPSDRRAPADEANDLAAAFTAGDEAWAAQADLRVRLAFGEDADLDLYVSDPMGETVYFANRVAASGGELHLDRRCGDAAPRIEEVVFPSARPGRYRVGIDFPERCDGGVGDAAFAVVVDARGRREERRGAVSLLRFEPIVLEVDVR